MSLIERAVSRLAGGSHAPHGRDAPASPLSVAMPLGDASSVESQTPHGADSHIATTTLEQRTPAPAGLESALVPPEREEPAVEGGRRLNIDLEALHKRGFVTPNAHQTRTAQEFRVIKRPLLANAFEQGAAQVANGKRVMVTSSFPGEGKSFCAINLALSIADERDHKVLLVDADVARPSVPRELSVETGPGLLDLLLDEHLDLASCVHPTNVEKLSLLAAGRRHPQATELLASAAMTRLLEQISLRFPDRIVIFDSPPLLITTESRVLAGYMGQIVLVVEAGKTPREAAKESLTMLDRSEVVGLVLNKARGTDGGGYGGYYGYGYGYGYGNS